MKIILKGENISRDNIPIYETIKILQSLQNMALLINEIKEKGPYANMKPSSLNPKKVPLAITEINAGSVVLSIDSFNPQQSLPGIASNSEAILNDIEQIFFSISRNEPDSIKRLLPYPEHRKGVLKQIRQILKIDSVGFEIVTSKGIEISPNIEWRGIINRLSAFERKIVKADLIGFLNLVDARKYDGQIKTGDYLVKFKDPEVGAKLKHYYDKNIYIEGEVQLVSNKKKELILVGMKSVRELPDEFEVKRIYYKDKIFLFSKPLVLTIKTLEDGIIEVAAPEIKVFGYGYKFEDAWLDFKETFDNAHYLIKYSGKPVSKRSKAIIDFINTSCEVKPFGC